MEDAKPSPDAAPPSLAKPTCPTRLMQEGETAKAYAAFRSYFEMGHARNLPELAKNVNASVNSLYKWAKCYRWDGRIDAAHEEVATAFRRATEKAMDVYAAQLVRQKMEIAQGNHKIALASQTKALEIIKAMRVYEQVQKIVSPDGKTTHLTLRPAANIRLADATRLAVTANTLMMQAESLIVMEAKGGNKAGTGSAQGLPSDVPGVVVFLDGGDGVPMPLSTLPPPDEVDLNFNPYDGTSSTSPDDIPAPSTM